MNVNYSLEWKQLCGMWVGTRCIVIYQSGHCLKLFPFVYKTAYRCVGKQVEVEFGFHCCVVAVVVDVLEAI